MNEMIFLNILTFVVLWLVFGYIVNIVSLDLVVKGFFKVFLW